MGVYGVYQAPRFVDRERELGRLLELASRGAYAPLYLYGPEGCGKTRLLRELVERLRGVGDYVVVYVDALEQDSVEKALEAPGWLKSLVVEAVREATTAAGVKPLGALVSRLLVDVLARLEEWRLRGRHLVVLVDDVARPLGLEGVEAYVKRLLSLVEHELTGKGLRSVLIVATTSEGVSLRRVLRHPTWARVALLWNLERRPTLELVESLSPPPGVDAEHVYTVTGGNPRAVVRLAYDYEWRVDEWLRSLEHGVLAHVVHEASSRGLLGQLESVVDDPDTLAEADPRIGMVASLLLEYNLVVYKAVETLGGDWVKPDPELGVGRLWAWQLPAYVHVLRRLLRALKSGG